uniref:Uncharacterized protein n=1 Tax=Pantoea phage Survivor TaxID=3232176 RepID=A0AAU8KXX7_9CAUD
MMYENRDRYLLLKQTLVLLELSKLKAIVSVNGKDSDKEKLIESAVKTLATIEEYFTLPREMLENATIYLDLRFEAAHIEGMCKPVPSEGDDRYSQIPKTHEDMQRCIFDFPNMNNYKEVYSQNCKNKSFFDNSRANAGDMIAATSVAIRTIRKYVEGSTEYDFSLGQILMLVNMVEATEWLFEFTNATSRRVIDAADIPGC